MAQNCPVCGSEENVQLEIIDIAEQHANYCPSDANVAGELTNALSEIVATYRMKKCCHCGLEYAEPFVSPGPKWYRTLYSNLKLFPESRWEFEYVSKFIREGQCIFDYGCGDGAFMTLLKNNWGARVEVRGGDFSSAAVENSRENGLKVNVIGGNGELEGVPRGAFHHIVAFHVLEHLESPKELFQFARSISNRDARLWIAVPSDKRPIRKLGGEDFLDQPPHHLSRWTEKSLEMAGIDEGWKMHALVYEPIGIRTRAWEVSRRHALYYRMVAISPRLERLARLILFPFIGFQKPNELSGFSMLASYERRPQL